MADVPRSVERLLVDQALADQTTNFDAFVNDRRSAGLAWEDVWIALRESTGQDVSLRTFYRWIGERESA